MLIAGAHLNLGRASSITGHTAERHQKHFKAAAGIVFGPERAAATEKLIEFEQLSQLERAVQWQALAPPQKALKNTGEQ